MRGAGAVTAALRLVTLVAAIVAGVAVLHHVSLVPDSDMGASRVVPAVALARGFPIYAGPDQGPIIDFMYGPVAAVAFLPAALMSTPAGALTVAVLVNLLLFFVPMAWLHRRVAGGRDVAAAALVLFVLGVLRDPGLAFSAFTIHADAPALGLGAIACGLLATAPRPMSGGRLAAIAFATALAVWTKQTMAPLGAALALGVLVRDGWRPMLRYVAWTAACGLVLGVLFAVAFGWTPLVFNMLTLPSRMPWYGEATNGRVGTVLFVAGLLARLAWLPALVVALLLLWAWRRGDDARATVHVTGLLALVAVALAPAAVLGGSKVGGYLNTFSVVSYFLVAAATTGLAIAARAGNSARVVLAMLLVIVAVGEARGPAGLASTRASVARLRAWGDGPHERAYRTALAHPGEIDFPWNPLAVLLAENRLDNSEIGAWNRDLAGVPISDTLWRRYLPPRLRLLAFRPPSGAFTWLPAPMRRLPEFTEPGAVPGLEGWTVLAPRSTQP